MWVGVGAYLSLSTFAHSRFWMPWWSSTPPAISGSLCRSGMKAYMIATVPFLDYRYYRYRAESLSDTTVRSRGGSYLVCHLARCRRVYPTTLPNQSHKLSHNKVRRLSSLPLRRLPTRCCEVAGRIARAPRVGFGPFHSRKPARACLCAASAVPGCRGSA